MPMPKLASPSDRPSGPLQGRGSSVLLRIAESGRRVAAVSLDRLTLTLDVENLLSVVSAAEQQAMEAMGIDLSNSLVIVLAKAN